MLVCHRQTNANQKLGQLDPTIQNSQRENKKKSLTTFQNRPYRREKEKKTGQHRSLVTIDRSEGEKKGSAQ